MPSRLADALSTPEVVCWLSMLSTWLTEPMPPIEATRTMVFPTICGAARLALLAARIDIAARNVTLPDADWMALTGKLVSGEASQMFPGAEALIELDASMSI